MNDRIACAVLALLLCFGVPSLAGAGLPVAVGGKELPSLAPILEKVMPAVVNIATTERVRTRQRSLLSDPFFRRFFDLPMRSAPRERLKQSLGSGVVVDAAKGLIITNHHVIQKAEKIIVGLKDGRRLKAEVVGVDPDSDVAVIRVSADGLKEIPTGDSDKLRVGDFVVAVGNPFGLGQTVTSGIVSALGRSGLGIEGYEDFIQTDASINPGNSGGALINLRGELIGINTAILAPSGGNVGIGFAIPANMAQRITGQLLKYGKVRRGLFGLSAQDLTPELARALGATVSEGAVVTQVESGSPADKAGLEEGDVVTGVNDRPVVDADALRNALGMAWVGEKVVLKVVRNGGERTLRARMEEPQRVRMKGGRIDDLLEGAVLEGIGGKGYSDPDNPGIKVLEVDHRSNAWHAGFREGDLILAANGKSVARLPDLAEGLERRVRQIRIKIRRDGENLLMLIR